MGEQIPQELVDRMVEMTRKMALQGTDQGYSNCYGAHEEARAIVADLPAPIDPDIQVAIEAAQVAYGAGAPRLESLEGTAAFGAAMYAIKRIRSENNHG